MIEYTRHEMQFLGDYYEQMVHTMHMLYPHLTATELGMAIDEAMQAKAKNPLCMIDNNYKHVEVRTTLLELTQYIHDKQPILTNQGVMFARHGTVPNPIAKMLMGFLTDRKKMKKMMFQYPKGTADFTKYNLLQLLLNA